MNGQRTKQGGFTLIELILVIVILGALAVIALPAFVDLQDDADRAAAEGVAGALSAGSAINFAAKLAQGTAVETTDCDMLGALLTGGTLPSGYSIDAGAPGGSDGAPFNCTLNSPEGNAVAFQAFTVVS